MRKYFRILGAVLGVAFVGIQFVPVDRSNPPVTREIAWDSPETRALARRACMDCHSNETTWPWYSYVAPISWRVADHVEDGRGHLNFSTWDKANEDMDEVKEQVEEGEMPLNDYLLLHGEARLSDAEKAALLQGLGRTFEADPPIERKRRPRPESDD
jgi:hypothetical protein